MITKMKFLAIGINPSKQKGTKEFENFRSNSKSDKKINGAFGKLNLIYEKNYKFEDFINKQMSNKEFKELSNEEKIKLCEEYKPELLKKIKKFKPDYIFVLFKNDFCKGFSKFLNLFKNQIKIPIIHIRHPSSVSRWPKQFMTIEEYAKYIKNKIEKNEKQNKSS